MAQNSTEITRESGSVLGGTQHSSVKIGWTSPDYGIGSGTLQVGLENGRPAVNLNVGWGAAGGKGFNINTHWVSTQATAGQSRVWFGGSFSGRANIGPIVGRFAPEGGDLVIAPGSGVKGYVDKSGFDVNLRPSAALSAQGSVGAFLNIGFVAPTNVLYQDGEN